MKTISSAVRLPNADIGVHNPSTRQKEFDYMSSPSSSLGNHDVTAIGKPRARRILTRLLVGTVALFATTTAFGQALGDIKAPTEPLVLKDQGSFFVGGKVRRETAVELSSPLGTPLADSGTVWDDKMYVEYMVPASATGTPVVMVHGATLTGKTFETTPDGRMGWEEYFVRRGHAVYLPDQIGRGRSGFPVDVYNDVRNGLLPTNAMPNAFRLSNELGWKLFRFGPRVGTAYGDEQFPVEHVDDLARQAVPDLFLALANPNPNYLALSDLSKQIHGAVLMGHSQAGFYPLESDLVDDAGVKGMILVEPGRCSASNYTDATYAKFAKTPILIVFGDHLDIDTGVPAFNWQATFSECQAFIKRVNAAGGRAKMLHPPELGIKGNSHMIMQDRNNLQIADLILKWIHEEVDAQSKR